MINKKKRRNGEKNAEELRGKREEAVKGGTIGESLQRKGEDKYRELTQ